MGSFGDARVLLRSGSGPEVGWVALDVVPATPRAAVLLVDRVAIVSLCLSWKTTQQSRIDFHMVTMITLMSKKHYASRWREQTGNPCRPITGDFRRKLLVYDI